MKIHRTIFALLVALFALHAVSAAEPEDVRFKAKIDGSEQRYFVVKPEAFQAEKPCDLLIILHGHGSDGSQGVVNPPPEFRAAADVAAARGMLLVSPDYRAKTSWMGPKAEADVVQIIEELKAKYKIRKTIISGGSMGGSSSLTFAAMHPDLIDGVVSMNGTANHLEYENFQDAISESYGGSKRQIPEEYKKRSAEYWPERLTMPVAITAGGADTLVPPQSVVRLAGILQKLQPNVKLIFRETGGHNTTYEDTKEAYEFVADKVSGGKEGG